MMLCFLYTCTIQYVIMHIIINNTSGINAYMSLHRDDSADTPANIFEQMAVDWSVKVLSNISGVKDQRCKQFIFIEKNM